MLETAHKRRCAAIARWTSDDEAGARPRATSVDVYDEQDLMDWSEKLGVSRVEVLSAIVAVGTDGERLEAYLEARKRRR